MKENSCIITDLRCTHAFPGGGRGAMSTVDEEPNRREDSEGLQNPIPRGDMGSAPTDGSVIGVNRSNHRPTKKERKTCRSPFLFGHIKN